MSLLRVEAVSKSFGGVPVLRGISFSLDAGRTLGLVGENGAGKSTLMNILAGAVRPDAGQLEWRGRPYAPRRPADAMRAGIAYIHQELNLFPNLTIAENLFLTAFPRRWGLPLIDRRGLHRRAAALLEEAGLDLPPDLPVERLSAGERQLVEIARALGAGAALIILDEPTTSLGTREVERLFDRLARIRSQGVALIYISHALEDVLRLGDDLLVLRDGEVAGGGPRSAFTVERLVSLMVGRSLDRRFPPRAGRPGGETLLEARGLTRRGVLRDVGFRLRRGEILGVFGLMGAGRSELARILFGLDPCERGEILLEGRPLGGGGPRPRIRGGLAFVPEDRRREGLCLDASIADNLALVSLRRYARRGTGWLDPARWAPAVRAIRDAVRLTPAARDDQPVRTLSGGNQQKVVLGKWLLAGPRVFILDEPTRGIDVGAKAEIYRLIRSLADGGAGILFISSELEELIGLCDRILVMSHGEIRAEAEAGGFDREALLRAALRDPAAPPGGGDRP